MSKPPAWSSPNPHVPERAIDAFARHVMGLMLMAPTDDRSTLQHSLYSGVLLNFRGLSLWITAGHVLEEITAALEAFPGQVKGGWYDSHLDTAASAIPISLASLDSISFNSLGIDLGIVFLDTHAKTLIKANPRRAFLDHCDFRAGSEFCPDHYFVVGFPRDHVRLVTRDGRRGFERLHFRSGLICLRASLAQPNESDTHEFWKHTNGLYARLDPWGAIKKEVGTICGMSGGPIFGVCRKGDYSRYMLCGIQSAWLPAEGFVRGVTDAIMAHVLDEVVGCIVQRAQRHNG